MTLFSVLFLEKVEVKVGISTRWKVENTPGGVGTLNIDDTNF